MSWKQYGYGAELSVKAGQKLMTSSDPGTQAYHNRSQQCYSAEVMDHAVYSATLIPGAFHLFGPCKEHLVDK